MKLKLIIFCAAFLCSMGKSYAQWAVIDPTNIGQSIANMVKNIGAVAETTGATAQVFEQTKALYDDNKKYLTALQSVSGVIKDGWKVKQSAQMLLDMTDMYINDFNRFTADPYLKPEEIRVYMDQYNRKIKGATNLLQDMGNVVTTTGMSMSDKERIDMVDGLHGKMYGLNKEMLLTRLEVEGISTRRENKIKQKKALKELSGRPW